LQNVTCILGNFSDFNRQCAGKLTTKLNIFLFQDNRLEARSFLIWDLACRVSTCILTNFTLAKGHSTASAPAGAHPLNVFELHH
jgi:hypothetical protein